MRLMDMTRADWEREERERALRFEAVDDGARPEFRGKPNTRMDDMRIGLCEHVERDNTQCWEKAKHVRRRALGTVRLCEQHDTKEA